MAQPCAGGICHSPVILHAVDFGTQARDHVLIGTTVVPFQLCVCALVPADLLVGRFHAVELLVEAKA